MSDAPTTTLGSLSVTKLNEIVDAVWKTFDGRRTVWGDRRRIRFRQMDPELSSLPLSSRAGGQTALMIYQTEEPNQEVHRRVKRLIANKPRVEVITYASDSDTKEDAQNMKDALKALWKQMNRGSITPDRLATTYQQGDGEGCYKLDLIADYADDVLSAYDPDSLMGDGGPDDSEAVIKARSKFTARKGFYEQQDETDLMAPERAYHDVVHDALKRCDPPFRLTAPDPTTYAYNLDGQKVEIVVEKGKRPMAAMLKALGSKGVRMVNNKLVVFPTGEDALGHTTLPENQNLDKRYDDLADYTEIRNRTEICIMIRQPKLRQAADRSGKTSEDGYVKITFDNPFGPYSTGYVLVPGDVSGSLDPADAVQPSILGTLNLAQKINVLTTIRLSAAIDTALAPPYIEADAAAQPAPQLDQARENKTPGVKDGEPIAVIPGKLARMASANIDLDKAEQRFMTEESLYRFNEVLAGDSTSSDSGHKLAIQVSQADTQLVPYQNSRAEAIAEVLMACMYACKKLGRPIYVKEIPDQQQLLMNKVEMVQPIRALLPEYFDMDFNLIVTIGSETPVTKFAKWSALQQRYEKGTLSFETMMEQSDVENVADEIARIFEGQTLVAVMQQAIPVVVKMIAQRAVAKIMAPAGGGAGGPQDTVGQGGNENGGGAPGAAAMTPIAGVGRVPGVGMNPAGPPEEAPGGTQPGGAELAPAGAP